MRRYIRSPTNGATYFFTVNLAQRKQNDLLIRHIYELREAFKYTKRLHPMMIEAMVVLPEHLHCIWRLPGSDDYYSLLWRLLKSHFSRHIQKKEFVYDSRLRKNERGIWQRRYLEHQIRDETDFQRHLDYIPYNPVKPSSLYTSAVMPAGLGHPVPWTAASSDPCSLDSGNPCRNDGYKQRCVNG